MGRSRVAPGATVGSQTHEHAASTPSPLPKGRGPGRGGPLCLLSHLLVTLCLLILSHAAQAEVFSVDWDVIAAGGDGSSGGVYSVCDTVGQPQTEFMSGGSYYVEAGFWSLEPAQLSPGGNHPPVTPAMSYTRVRSLTLKIAKASVLAGCSDVDGDTLTLTGVGTSVQGAAVRLSGDYIQYYNAPNNSDDSFAYTVTDSQGGISTGVINVVVVQSAGTFVSADVSGGKVTLKLAGIPGYRYDVFRSASLVSWGAAPVATLTAPANGVFDWADPSPLWPSGFYRLKQAAAP